MDILVNLLHNAALFAFPIVAYILFFRSNHSKNKIHRIYSRPDWNFILKKWWAYITLKKMKWTKKKRPIKDIDFVIPNEEDEDLEKPQRLRHEESVDSMSIFGADHKGNFVHLKITRLRHRVSEVWLQLRFNDGTFYQLPCHPHTVIHNNISRSWSAAGLKMQVCEPLRRWRLTFNGLLRRGIRRKWSPEISDDLIDHVQFSFLWTACSNPVDIQQDWSPGLLCEAVAKEPWRDGHWLDMVKEFGSGYDQWGTLYGTCISSGGSPKVLHLQGLRQRRWGLNQTTWKHRSLNMTGVVTDGTMYNISATSSLYGITHATFGHVRESNGRQVPVNWCDVCLPNIGEHRDCIPKHLVLRFSAGGKSYTAVLDTYPQNCSVLYGGHPWSSELHLEPFQCGLNTKQGVGVSEYWYRCTLNCPIPPPLYVHHLMEPEADVGPLVVIFSDRECQNSTIVGGKGASLALMDSLCDPKLKVPPGFCLTVTALENHLTLFPQLQEAITRVQKISWGQAEGDLKDECERTVHLFEATPVCESVKEEVLRGLQRFGQSQPWAVRSSAVGEDSEDLSAAGQNETFLGLHDESQIIEAIQKCWGSLYTFQSVEYRRQHGQLIQCGMGIVIQCMVPADTAGVLFTRHPFTGTPDQMLITANYGLGESVVSAQIEPDTIILTRNWQDGLTVLQTTCGSKKHKIEMTAEGGVTTLSQEGDTVSQLCISIEQQLELGQIGVQLEVMFGGPRDIEWAIAKGEIYLLQARPITSLNPWSDFELLHELDSPINTDTELLTIANTGEVFPGATSPLTQSFIVPLMEKGIRYSSGTDTKKYQISSINLSHHHVLLNMLNTCLQSIDKTINISNKAADLAVFGHPVTTPDIHHLGLERNGHLNLYKKTKHLFGILFGSISNNHKTKKAQRIHKHVKLNSSHFTTAKVFHKAITLNMEHLMQVSACHSHVSAISFFSQLVAAIILVEGKEELTADHSHDISLLLSSCSDVISADVPTALRDLADCITWTGRGEEFCSLPPLLAVEWLELNSGDTSVKYKDFLSKHGYRCIREFDVMSESWSMKPDIVVQTLQAMVKSLDKSESNRQLCNDTETIGKLKSVTKDSTRKMLSWLLPWCRRSVSNREATKASVISVIHEFRIAYRTLSKLMQQEGKLPDPDLVFFMTHYELGQLIQTRDPVLLKKAIRRKKLWPDWNQLTFPEISKGLPAPITTEMEALSGDPKTHIQGTPACSGTVMGRACVVVNLEDISQLNKGDILITRSTDIGWSPYFPLLKGVVTELGGLISHGAVVAREYGLPCVVGAKLATTVFKTGDTVLLVGATGVLEKIGDDLSS